MMKKICRIFLFVIIVSVLILTGCSSGEEKVTLRFSDWHLTEAVWEKSLSGAIEEFERQNPNIRVINEPVPYEEKDNRYFVESEAGMAPDVYHVHCNSLQYYFTKGYAKDLTRFVRQEGGEKYLSDWFELPVDMCRLDGKLMAMPGDYMSMVLFYNTKLFKDVGINPPKPPRTYEEFLYACERLTLDKDGDGEDDQWGFTTVGAMDPGFELRFSPFLWGFGGDYLTEDGKHSALNRPETIAGFKSFVELSQKYMVVPPGVLRNTPEDSRTQFANEIAVMELGSGWTIPIVDNINPGLKAKEVLVAAPFPCNSGDTTSAWLSAWIMSSNTKYPKEAWKLMKFITSREMELKWFRDNSVLSSRKDVSMSLEIQNDKFARVILSQLPNARFVPQIEEWPEIIAVVTNAVQESINEIKSPEVAILEAHKKVEEILNRKE